MIYANQEAVVLGLGLSGEAAAGLLCEEGARVTVCESADTPGLRQRARALAERGVRVLFGEDAESDVRRYDVGILSPGIDPASPLVRNVAAKRVPIIGEIELAFCECLCPVVAITGTNGKTTTTGLTAAMLDGSGVRTVACGNIGLPFSSAVRQSGELDVIVLEVSSFQLEAIRSFRPHVAAWLNFSPNHLDRYPDVESYRAAKLRIFENQGPGDFAVVNARENLPRPRARVTTFSSGLEDADFTLRETVIHHFGHPVLDQSETLMPGVHNAENLMAAMAIGHALGVELSLLASSARNYRPPAHRCEFVREREGVRWVNDSKSTNLDALEKALLAQNRRVILIAGGKDKGFGFGPVADLVRTRTRTAVLIGQLRERIAADWAGMDCQLADSLEEAVEVAAKLARPGETVLFSPGTSSFDMFRDYTERGERFKAAVHGLPQNTPTHQEI
jgi:UDP-N-acetylmuramoylalanine--D-glutamate ligase